MTTDNYHREHTRAILEGRAGGTVTPLLVVVDIAQTEPPQAQRLDDTGHTVCELDRSDLRALLVLATADRAALLAERRGYVLARKGDMNRFVALLQSMDVKIEAATKLVDKLAKLYAVQS